MTRRSGKAPSQAYSSSATEEHFTPRTHLGQHLHLTNNIHVKNHMHMNRKENNRMLDPRRAPQLPLQRELTAVKKVKSLQDPSTSSCSFSPVSACNSVCGHECRANNGYGGAHLDELQSQERVRRQPRWTKGREETEELVDRHRETCNGIGHGENLRRRDTDEYAALAQWSDRHRDHHHLFSNSHANTAAGYRVEEKWQGDAAEIARRLIAEQNGRISSPAHAYMASLARAHGLSLLGFRDDITTSETEGSFLESEDNEAGLMATEHLSNSAESPLVIRGHRNRRRWKDTSHGNANLRVGLQNSRGRRAVNGYKEAPVIPAITDELDVSEIPQNGCGVPWYKPTSNANKYKSRSLLNYACAIPEAVATKKVGASEKVTRKSSSRHVSQRDLQVPIDHPDNHEDEVPNGEIEQPPAREALPGSVINTQEESQCLDDKAQARNSSVSHKYRPRSFKDMVGQSLVVKSLTTAITKGKLAQVYLFAGPRGTGKTTCARVFAAALVCLNVEPHRRPCGLCRECATLTLNRSRDVREIDVAGSSDLNQMSSLLNVSPRSNARQRVFIVKGCDFSSVELWTSFVKFLDDPPWNVVFILITTDLGQLTMSATSRCQKYHFGKLKESEIVTRLRVLVEKEKLDVDEAALSLIASLAEGSLRDAESMLDRLSLLDQTISLSMVQELSGLIPDEKLVDLLDMALAADTVNTVKGMRELLDAGVDALSLVAQLASLITDILAGTFDLRRETRKQGFFHRNMSRKEEQQRLRQALKVLAECEKQLRASNDKPTWLIAALLQFAPDRSYLPSSVDTSKAPSPIAFDTFERLPSGNQPSTPRLPPPQPSARKHFQKSSQKSSPNIDVMSRFHSQKDKEKASSPVGRKATSNGNHLQAKLDDRGLRSVVLFDASRVGNRDFRVLSRRDMKHIWDKVLDECRSKVLRQLLSSHGTLISLSIASDETFAVAHVEFVSSEHKARAERLRSSTCHAFQMALGCPVELKLSLESCPPSVALEDFQASHAMHCGPSSSGVKTHTANTVEYDAPSDPQLAGQQRNIQPRSSRHEMLTGLAARSRRLADAESGPRFSSRASSSDYKYCFPAAGSSRRYRSGRRPSLIRVPSLDAPGVKVRWKHPKCNGITNMERKKRKLKSRRRRTVVALCWQSPLSDQEQPQNQIPEHSRKVGFFLRLVPCGRSIQTHGSPSRREPPQN